MISMGAKQAIAVQGDYRPVEINVGGYRVAGWQEQTVDGLPLCDATGALVTVEDAAAKPVVSLTSHITAVQEGEGDPSPDNVRPIVGWDAVTVQRAGKNLIDPALYLSSSRGTTLDGDVFTTIFSSGALFFNAKVCNKLKKGTYELTIIPVGTEFYASINLYRGANTNNDRIRSFPVRTTGSIVQETFTTTEDFFFAMGGDYNSGNSNYGTFSYRLMLKANESTTEYEPYTGETHTAALPETVYGGTLDWRTGLLTVTHRCAQVTGAEDWTLLSGMPDGQYAYQWKPSDYMSSTLHGMCTHYYVSTSYRTLNVIYYGIRITINAAQETLAEFKAYLAAQHASGTPVTIVYKLSEPYTIQLTPQQLHMLRGDNVVWSDCGETALTYKVYSDAEGVTEAEFADTYNDRVQMTVQGAKLEQDAEPTPEAPQPIHGTEAVVTVSNADTEPVQTALPVLYGRDGVCDVLETDVIVDGVHRSRVTRQWKTIVLTGRETVNKSAESIGKAWLYYIERADLYKSGVSTAHAYATHFAGNQKLWSASGIGVLTNMQSLIFGWYDNNTADDFKAYLAAQYAAGTPVTVVYRLAEPVIELGDPIDIRTLPRSTIIGSTDPVSMTVKTVDRNI